MKTFLIEEAHYRVLPVI